MNRSEKHQPLLEASRTGPGAAASGETPASPQSTLETVDYILPMLKSLIALCGPDDLKFLKYLLEIAMLHAAEIELKCRNAKPWG